MRCIKPISGNILTLSDGRTVTLLEMVGAGRYGIVHRAVVESGWGIRRPAAVKRLHMSPDADPGVTMRALGEIARRLVCIRHPSVIELYEVDRTDRLHAEPHTPFTLTEIVEGESLQSLLNAWRARGARAPMDFSLVVTLRTAEALGAALFTEGPDGALTGLIHGDLSPRQILITSQGEVKVGDFGQFTLADAQSHVRRGPLLTFTAPEIVWGNSPDARSDVFSLGAILRELLIGPRFREGTSTREVMQLIRDGQFHDSLLEPNIPRSLRDIIYQATDANPANRYGHARAFAFDLRREMFRLNLTDAQLSVRHAVVGWCEAPADVPATPATVPESPKALHPVEDAIDAPPMTERMPETIVLDASDLENDLEEGPPSRQHSDIVPAGTALQDLEDDLPAFIFGNTR